MPVCSTRPTALRKSSSPTLLLILAIQLFSAPVSAKTADQLQSVEAELARQQQHADKLAATEQDTVQSLGALQQKLVGATAALQGKQAEQERLETQLAILEKDSAARAALLDANRKHLANLTAAMLHLSMLPPEAFLLHEDQSADHTHRAILLRAILPRLKAETEKIAVDLTTLEAMRRKAVDQKRLLDAARQNLDAQRINLDAMVSTRQGLLQNTAAERVAMAEKMAALTAEAQNLRQLLEKVSQPAIPAAPAAHLKTGLILPVAGKVTRSYGARDAYGVASEGLTITAPARSPVTAPQDGQVVFAGPFRGYGRIVIIQHAGGYHSFLAGLGRIDAEVGQSVKAGEPLGVLPEAAATADLYFEWRRDGEPVDPTIAHAANRH